MKHSIYALLALVLGLFVMSTLTSAQVYTGEPPNVPPPPPPTAAPTPTPTPAPKAKPTLKPKPPLIKPLPPPPPPPSPPPQVLSATAATSVADSVPTKWWAILLDPVTFERENFGYNEPILDPTHITSPLHFSLDPGVIGTNFFLALLFFLIMGLTSWLFNNIVEGHGDDIHHFLHRFSYIQKVTRWYGRWEHVHQMERGAILVLLVLAYALIGVHINPSFSLLHLTNIGMLVVAMWAVIIGYYANDFFRGLVARSWRCTTMYKPHPFGLLVAIGCVLASRSMDVSPGYLFGMPIGLFLVEAVPRGKHLGFLEFLGIFFMMIVGLLAWGLMPILASYQIISDFLSMSYVILIESAFFILFPLGYLPGHVIFTWKKWLWGSMFIVDVFLLLHTLFNPNSTLGNLLKNPPALNTILLMGGFAAFTILLWVTVMVVKWMGKRKLT